MGQRVRRQIVGCIVSTIPVQIQVALTAIDHVSSVPVGYRVAEYRVVPAASLQRGRPAPQIQILLSGSIPRDRNRLAAEIENGAAIRKIVERDAREPGESRKLIDVERAAAIQRQHV